MENKDPLSWSIYSMWNDSLERRTERELKPRQNMWASELGGSFVDRYLKMTAVVPTNPPNPRSLRKFEAGNLWEAIVGYVLKRAGLLLDAQGWLAYQYPGLIQVTGKLDYKAGGIPNFQLAKEILDKEFSWLPETIRRGTDAIITGLSEKYAMQPLNEIVLEIKSCSSFMFDVYERSGHANPNHKLQLFHYLKASGLSEGHVLYICKDDCRMLEIGVFNVEGGETEKEYKSDIETMTKYLKAGERPPLEDAIVFDKEFTRFSANWKVAYSNYLTFLYGLKSQMEFDEVYKPKAERYNRVMKRIVNGDKMTKLNLEVIDDMKKDYKNLDEMVAICKLNPKMLTREEDPVKSAIEEKIAEKELVEK